MRATARVRWSFAGSGSLLRHASSSGAPLVSRCLSQASAPVLTTRTAWTSSSASRRLAGLRRLMATPVILHAGRSSLLAAGITVKATTDHPTTAYALDQRYQQGVAQKVEDKVDEAQRALADAKRKEAEARPPEWYVILMGFTGALVGYATAMALKFVGRYVFYFAAAETTALLALTATGAITRQTALEVAKYTMPPFAWALKTVINAARGQFQQIFSASSLALRFFFVLSFGLTLRYSRAGPKPSRA